MHLLKVYHHLTFVLFAQFTIPYHDIFVCVKQSLSKNEKKFTFVW